MLIHENPGAWSIGLNVSMYACLEYRSDTQNNIRHGYVTLNEYSKCVAAEKKGGV